MESYKHIAYPPATIPRCRTGDEPQVREEGILPRTGLPERIPQGNHRRTCSTLRRQEGGKCMQVAHWQLLLSQLFFLPALKKQKNLQESLGSLLSTVRKAGHTAQAAPHSSGVLDSSGSPAQMSEPASPARKVARQPLCFLWWPRSW